jgi:hypothetical protein
VTLPEYFLVPLTALPRSLSEVSQLSEPFGHDPALQRGFGANFDKTPYPFYPGPRPSLSAGQSASWYFGESLGPESATLLFTKPAPAGTAIRFGLVDAAGTVRWAAPRTVPTGASSVAEQLPQARAVGLEVQALGPLPPAQAVITVSGRPYELSGALSSAVVPGSWRQVGEAQGFTVFATRRLPEPITAVTADGRKVPVRVLSSNTKSEVVRVDAPEPLSVIRSVAWDSGWRGSVSVNGGPVRSVPVRSDELVQAIAVPAGDDEVTFVYRPPHLLLGSVLSVGSVVFLLALGIVSFVRRRSRGRSDRLEMMAAPEHEDVDHEMAVLVSDAPSAVHRATPADGVGS